MGSYFLTWEWIAFTVAGLSERTSIKSIRWCTSDLGSEVEGKGAISTTDNNRIRVARWLSYSWAACLQGYSFSALKCFLIRPQAFFPKGADEELKSLIAFYLDPSALLPISTADISVSFINLCGKGCFEA